MKLLAQLILFPLRILPWKFRELLALLVGVSVFYCSKRNSQIAQLQLQKILGLSLEESIKITKLVFINLSRNIFQSINLKPALDLKVKPIYLENETDLQYLMSLEKPLLFISAHFSNWELLAAYYSKRFTQLNAIGKMGHNSLLQELLSEVREKNGVNTIWRSPSSLFELKSLFSKNAKIAALLDQDTKIPSTNLTFLNHNASTPSTLIKIALKANALIISAFLVEEKDYYKISWERLDTLNTTTNILNAYNKELEQLLIKYPSQWAWIHKRWRTLTSGKSLSSSEYIKYLQEL